MVGRGHRASRGDDAGHGLGQYGSELEAGSGHVADAARLCTLDTIRVRPRKAAVVRSDGARPIADSLPVDLEVPPGEGVRDGGDDSGVEGRGRGLALQRDGLGTRYPDHGIGHRDLGGGDGAEEQGQSRPERAQQRGTQDDTRE